MLKVNNWSSLQSYKDRKPPWIRLHKTLLDNFEFHSMSKNARALLPMLWLLASEDKDPTSGIIPYNLDQISFRLRMTKKDLESGLNECISSEFIQQNQPCNESVTKPLQVRNSHVPPETETETDYLSECFANLWKNYPKKDGRKAAKKHFYATVKNQKDCDDISLALNNYKQSIAGVKLQFVKNGSTWFNNWQDWIDFKDESTPATGAYY